MVFPLYRRHRFDGATTNLFAYPLISALCGSSIRQPIGGDCGLGRDLIHLALKTPVPTAARGYGIDIFLTALALGSGLPVTQVPLGRKPSHPRRHLIFTQVAAALLDTLRHLKVPGAWRPNGGGSKPDRSASIDDAAHTPVKPDTKQRADEARRELSACLPSNDWADPGVIQSLAQGELLSAELWAELLACWISTGLADGSICALEHSRQLLPLYFLRMDAFWLEIDGRDPAAVEDRVSGFVQLLSKTLGTLIK